MPNILFIGAGEIGTALAHVVGGKARVELWDMDAGKTSGMRPLEESVPGAAVVFLCVPSFAVRNVLARIRSLLRPEAVIVSLAKGIETQTRKTMDAVIQETLPAGQQFGILGGPLLAEEIAIGKPGIGVFASTSRAAFDVLLPLFTGSCVRLEYCDDPREVAIVSTLKNIYAVGLGVAEGLGWGWNGKGWLAAMALREIEGIAAALGCKPGTVKCSAGAGDFLATSMSPDSTNRETGRKIAQTGVCAKESEGCRSVSPVVELLGGDPSPFPFLTAIGNIINQHENPQTVFENLLASP